MAHFPFHKSSFAHLDFMKSATKNRPFLARWRPLLLFHLVIQTPKKTSAVWSPLCRRVITPLSFLVISCDHLFISCYFSFQCVMHTVHCTAQLHMICHTFNIHNLIFPLCVMIFDQPIWPFSFLHLSNLCDLNIWLLFVHFQFVQPKEIHPKELCLKRFPVEMTILVFDKLFSFMPRV